MSKFQVFETDQYQPVGEEFEAGDITEALDATLREHGYTVREIADDDIKEDTNKRVIILYHDISYYFSDDSSIGHRDAEYKHIRYMITEGFCEGELNKINPKDDENMISGWWKIVR
jgi:hypothetical protein